MSAPCLPFVSDDAEVPHAGDGLIGPGGAQLARPREGGEEDPVVQLVLVFPPGHENEVGVAALVAAQEAQPVATLAQRGLWQRRLGDTERCLDELGAGFIACVCDAVDLQGPAAERLKPLGRTGRGV